MHRHMHDRVKINTIVWRSWVAFKDFLSDSEWVKEHQINALV